MKASFPVQMRPKHNEILCDEHGTAFQQLNERTHTKWVVFYLAGAIHCIIHTIYSSTIYYNMFNFQGVPEKGKTTRSRLVPAFRRRVRLLPRLLLGELWQNRCRKRNVGQRVALLQGVTGN